MTRALGQADMFGWQDPAPLPPDDPDSVRTILFRDGLALLRRLTGMPEQATRRLVAKLLRDARDDAALVAEAIRRADDLRPAEPVAWLCGSVRALANPRRSRLDRIADDLGLTHIDQLDIAATIVEAHAEPVRRLAIPHQGGARRGR